MLMTSPRPRPRCLCHATIHAPEKRPRPTAPRNDSTFILSSFEPLQYWKDFWPAGFDVALVSSQFFASSSQLSAVSNQQSAQTYLPQRPQWTPREKRNSKSEFLFAPFASVTVKSLAELSADC